jgi:hypothetical protein
LSFRSAAAGVRDKKTTSSRPELFTAIEKVVISTEAMNGLIVHRAVERPPHFAFVFAVAFALFLPMLF